MPRETPKAKEDHRLSGRAEAPEAKLPTYQELLDLALDDTFPASDPLAIGAAEHVAEPRTTPADVRDWTLQPGATVTGPDTDARSAARGHAARCGGRVREALVCERDEPVAPGAEPGTVEVPPGACTITQDDEVAVLRWRTGDGAGRSVAMPLDLYRRLLADGLVERDEPV